MAGMPLPAVVAALAAALVHVWFFALESVLFERPTVFRRFGLRSAEEAAVVRPMAFNQGFYVPRCGERCVSRYPSRAYIAMLSS